MNIIDFEAKFYTKDLAQLISLGNFKSKKTDYCKEDKMLERIIVDKLVACFFKIHLNPCYSWVLT